MLRRLSQQVSWPKGHAKVLLEAVEGLELVGLDRSLVAVQVLKRVLGTVVVGIIVTDFGIWEFEDLMMWGCIWSHWSNKNVSFHSKSGAF